VINRTALFSMTLSALKVNGLLQAFTKALLLALYNAVVVSLVCPSVCLSVCLAQAGTVPKWLKVGSCKQTPYDSPGILVFSRQTLRQNSNGKHLLTKFSQLPSLHTFITSSPFDVLAVFALHPSLLLLGHLHHSL